MGPPDGDLGDLLAVSRANVTGLIDHLEQKGLVKRFVHEADRRARYARITQRANKLLDELIPCYFSKVKTLLGDLDTEEKSTLERLLGKARLSLVNNTHAALEQEFT